MSNDNVVVDAVWEEIEITIPDECIKWDGAAPIIIPSKTGVKILIAEQRKDYCFARAATGVIHEKYAKALANHLINSTKKALP